MKKKLEQKNKNRYLISSFLVSVFFILYVLCFIIDFIVVCLSKCVGISWKFFKDDGYFS